MQTADLHLVYARGPDRLKVFDAKGKLLLNVECRNRTVRDGQYGHWGNCPAGTFVLGKPALSNTPPFGRWFILMSDWEGGQAMAAYRRAGIGLHGGGSGLPDPYAARQGWVITHGCLRLQNADLATVVKKVQASQKKGGRCYITVETPLPAAAAPPEEPQEPYVDVPVAELAPGE